MSLIHATQTMMRVSALLALLIAALLAACASDKDALASKNISQKGPLKVHPGLLGAPVPPELQPDARPSAAPAAAKVDAAAILTEPPPAEQRQ